MRRHRERIEFAVETEGGVVYEIFTYGRLEVPSENEDAFLEAWSAFAAWTSARPGAKTLRLARDVRNPGRFISFGQWDDADAVREWKSSDEFKQRLGAMVKPASEFEPTELAVVRRAADGSVEALSPPQLEPIHTPI
jgi:heme-degrading monooxygenase HmoA